MTEAVAIINVTPDSFSDGGRFENLNQIENVIIENLEEGVKFFDVGGESTRPGATLVSEEEELERVGEALELIKKKFIKKATFSIDSRHSKTIEKALNCGFSWVNDVSGFTSEKNLKLAAKYGAYIVIMHSLTVPADPKITIPADEDVIEVLINFANKKLRAAESAGIKKENFIFDPGIGFGKTAEQSLEIINRIAELKKLDCRILVGHSRKSFLSLSSKVKADERDVQTLKISSFLATQKVDYLRVHDAISTNKIIKAN